MAEAVTLAHVARPAVLAQALEDDCYDVTFATDSRYDWLFPELCRYRRNLWSISSEHFLRALAHGKPIYSRETLERYVEDDLRVIDAVRPDLIVGDFRLSLSVSARLRQIPYATISNAYWSPYSRQQAPVPHLPMTPILGVRLSQLIFDLSLPLLAGLHCAPLNGVRRKYGLPGLGRDVQAVYTDADEVLLADMPDYFPISPDARHHRYLGPVSWSATCELPSWWDDIDETKPIVYVTLGSSGRVELLPRVLEALSQLPVTVLATTAGRTELASVPPNARVTEYLPGDAAAARAALVVCNGGSLTTYQAIENGTPVLGIPGNLDQHLNMKHLSAAGIGAVVRSEKASVGQIRKAALRLLHEPLYRDAAERARKTALGYRPQARFLSFVQACLGPDDVSSEPATAAARNPEPELILPSTGLGTL